MISFDTRKCVLDLQMRWKKNKTHLIISYYHVNFAFSFQRRYLISQKSNPREKIEFN